LLRARDVDHTIAHGDGGPSQAGNPKCLCRKHHLLKTFCGWLDRQLPDGTVMWTSPSGQSFTTDPGSRLLFPSLCRPTAPVTTPATPPSIGPSRGLMMPRRTGTRAQDRAKRIDAERARNRQLREHLRSCEGTQKPEKPWEDLYFPSHPPPPDTEDPPPF
jgi:hypothetical protein